MGSFEARNMRFCCVRDISIFEENVISIIKVRHIFYLMLAAFFVFAGAGKSLVISLFLAVLAVLAAFYPARAVSFEAYLYGLVFNSFPARKRVRVKLEPPGAENADRIVETGVEGFTAGREDHEEELTAARTRISIENMKRESRKID